MKHRLCFILSFVALVLLGGCKSQSEDGREIKKQRVVIYTSLDQVFSEPILSDFQSRSGVQVKAVYDVEAAKTTGLVNRLIAEKSNPQADVFWSSEVAQTIVLKRKGILMPYRSPAATDIPDEFKDPEGYWTGFAARARVLICNSDKIPADGMPDSIFELADPKWKGEVALANPLFGATSTHAAAIFALLGEQKAKDYFRSLKSNGVVIVAGNSTSRDRVRDGRLKVGFTDTDDANVAIQDGAHVRMIFPDQGDDGIGTLLIPNTVGLIANGPNREAGKRLVDYVLSREVEGKLACSLSLQIPVRNDVSRPENVPNVSSIRLMNVSFDKIADNLEKSREFLRALFIE